MPYDFHKLICLSRSSASNFGMSLLGIMFMKTIRDEAVDLFVNSSRFAFYRFYCI